MLSAKTFQQDGKGTIAQRIEQLFVQLEKATQDTGDGLVFRAGSAVDSKGGCISSAFDGFHGIASRGRSLFAFCGRFSTVSRCVSAV